MSNPIAALFGRSPIRPIQEHMANAQRCVILLGDFLNACTSNDWQKAQEHQQAIHAAENEADDLKSNVRTNLPKSLLLLDKKHWQKIQFQQNHNMFLKFLFF